MEVEEQINFQQAYMHDQEMRENETKCTPPTRHATAPAVTARAPQSMKQKNAKLPQNKAPVSLKPNVKETKIIADTRSMKNATFLFINISPSN